jgi:hypothetical protein
MKLNQATAATAAFLFATLASSSLATSSHDELKDKIAPPLASKPDHYLRSHRMMQSSYSGSEEKDPSPFPKVVNDTELLEKIGSFTHVQSSLQDKSFSRSGKAWSKSRVQAMQR